MTIGDFIFSGAMMLFGWAVTWLYFEHVFPPEQRECAHRAYLRNGGPENLIVDIGMHGSPEMLPQSAVRPAVPSVWQGVGPGDRAPTEG